MLKISNLHKNFKDKNVIKGMNLEISSNEIVALVGNNGAGKTTLFNLIMCYCTASSGSIMLFDNPKASREYIASNCLLIDEKMVYTKGRLCDIIDNQCIYNKKFCIDTAHRIMDKFNLRITDYYRKLSKGMKNQFNIAIGLASHSKILLLDEPTSGLDEMARYTFNNIIKSEFATFPRLIIVSTHHMGEMPGVPTKILIMHESGSNYYDADDVDGLFVRLGGDVMLIESMLGEKWHCEIKQIGEIKSAVTSAKFTYAEKKFIKDNNITIEPVAASEACRIICNERGCEVAL